MSEFFCTKGIIHWLEEHGIDLVRICAHVHNYLETLCNNYNKLFCIRIAYNSTFERVKEFKYLGTNLTQQNSIPEEIKSRLRLGNACYHLVQNLLSSRLLTKNLKIKIYRNIICRLFCMCVKLGR